MSKKNQEVSNTILTGGILTAAAGLLGGFPGLIIGGVGTAIAASSLRGKEAKRQAVRQSMMVPPRTSNDPVEQMQLNSYWREKDASVKSNILKEFEDVEVVYCFTRSSCPQELFIGTPEEYWGRYKLPKNGFDRDLKTYYRWDDYSLFWSICNQNRDRYFDKKIFVIPGYYKVGFYGVYDFSVGKYSIITMYDEDKDRYRCKKGEIECKEE